MAQQEGEWITVNGRHIMIGAGESREEAINRAIANKNADKKNEQIAKNKEQADKLNGKQKVLGTDEIQDKFTSYLKENKNGDSPEKIVKDFEKKLGQKIPDRFKERLITQVKMDKGSLTKNDLSTNTKSIYSDTAKKMLGKDWFELRHHEKAKVVEEYNKHNKK